MIKGFIKGLILVGIGRIICIQYNDRLISSLRGQDLGIGLAGLTFFIGGLMVMVFAIPGNRSDGTP